MAGCEINKRGVAKMQRRPGRTFAQVSAESPE